MPEPKHKTIPIPVKPPPAPDADTWVNGPERRLDSPRRRSRQGLRLQKITVQIPFALYHRLLKRVAEEITTERELVERLLDKGLRELEQEAAQRGGE